MDIIFLQELKVKTLIGIYPWELKVAQTIQLDLEVALPSSRACYTDHFEDALDYARCTSRRLHLPDRSRTTSLLH